MCDTWGRAISTPRGYRGSGGRGMSAWKSAEAVVGRNFLATLRGDDGTTASSPGKASSGCRTSLAPSSTGRAAGHSFERLGCSMRSCVDGDGDGTSTFGTDSQGRGAKRSTYTSDAISESRCGLHGSDRRHVNGNLDVAAWIKSVRGSLPTTDGVHGGTLTHFTCAMHFQSLSSDDRDSTAFSRCVESPSISNSETAGCRTARPNAQH